MASIFSTQNLQTFLRRKYLRPPSRPPPGPPGRGGRRSRSPNEGRSPDGRSPPAGRSEPELAVVALTSSAMMLLKISCQSSDVSRQQIEFAVVLLTTDA